MKKKVLALLLCLTILMQLAPIAAAEKGGQFAFAAMTGSAVVIQPTYISYAPGQTVYEALQESGHRFEGTAGGFINVIDGVEGSYSRYADDGDYDMDRPAEDISGFVFVGGSVELQNGEARAMCDMVAAMADFRLSDNGVKRYPEAKQAYELANSALFSGKADHAGLAADLRAAMTAYEQNILQAQKLSPALSFERMDGELLQDYRFTVSDLYETLCFGPEDQLLLRAGTYDFTLESGNSSACGTLLLTEDGQVQVGDVPCSTLCIPDGQWIGGIELRRSAGSDADAYPYADGAYFIPDCCDTVYIRIGKTAETPAEAGSYVTYKKANGGTVNSLNKPWNSTQAALSGVVNKSFNGNTVSVEAKCPYQGYTVMQTEQLQLKRTPTLRALTVLSNGVEQNIGFSSLQTDYALTVSSETLELIPQAFSEGCTVSVNGETLQNGGSRSITLKDGVTEISVSAACGGSGTDYTLSVTRAATREVTVLHDADVTVRVFNEADAEIGASVTTAAADTFELVPGQSYRYVAEKDRWFFTEESFSPDLPTVQARTPHTADGLSKLAVGSAQSTKYADFYLEEAAFSAQTHEYTLQVADPYPAVYVWAAAEGKASLSATGPMGRSAVISGNQNGQQVKIPASDRTSFVTVRVSEDDCYYQEYRIVLRRVLTLSDLKAAVDGEDTRLFQVRNGSVTNVSRFDEEIPDYQANIIRASGEAELTVSPFGASYYVTVNGTRYDLTERESGGKETAVKVKLPLDPHEDSETAEIGVCSDAEGAVFGIYRVVFAKNDAVATEIVGVDDAHTPIEGALTVVHDVQSGERIWPSADGTFPLVETMRYTYTVTCYGYVGVQGTLTAAKAEARIEVPLTKTDFGGIRTDITSGWPYFRGSADANGVVNVRTPIRAEDAMLSWANKLGEGYSSAAVSCPILITEEGYDYLIVYAGEKLFKVDAVSGTVVAVGQMERSSSFAINSPTYAEGMIFVGLSGGGVQAFRADTLESLWIYNDIRGGQPNCPIAYYDGYLYTGFWNSETTQANFVCLSVTDEDPSRTTEEKLPTWTHTDKGFYWAGCYVADGFLLVGTDDGDSGYIKYSSALLCMDPKTGEVLDSVQGIRGDIRSNVSYDRATDRYYFTTKGGYFCSVKVDTAGTQPKITGLKQVYLYNYADDPENPPMSTCTPVIYNGRAYVGVSGTGQFTAYSGHNLTVIDLSTWSIAYSVRTQGYPQTSGLLTTAYDGAVYVYFFDNFTPGKLRVLRDRPGQTAPDLITKESFSDKGTVTEYDTPYVLFTPAGDEAQYAICSPITDAVNGTIYFKNDSARLMALSNTVEKMEVTRLPDKLEYRQGETFDPTGMEITVTYSNGTVRTLPARRTVNGVTIDYFTWSDEPLSAEMPDLMIGFRPVLYQNSGDEIKVPYTAPQASVTLTITGADILLGDVNKDGTVDMKDLTMMIWHVNGAEGFALTQEQLEAADVDGSGKVDLRDVSYMIWYVNGTVTQFPAAK